MRGFTTVRDEAAAWRGLERRVADALELAELGDPSLLADLEKETAAIESEVALMDLNALLSGPYDDADAYLSIHAGAGGTDSQDWASMLERMFLRWTERRGFETEILDRMPGEEAGIKSVNISVKGTNV